KEPDRHGTARRRLGRAADAAAEAALKTARGLGGKAASATGERPRAHEHFGFLLASCEGADLRPMADRIVIYGEERREEMLPPPAVPRAEVIDELYEAVVNGRAPVHSGEWAMATTELCLAIRRSAAERREIALEHQV